MEIENRMVVDSELEEKFFKFFEEDSNKPNGKGCLEISTGIFVPEEDMYRYAIERISQDEDLWQEFREMLVEWFYSGNWVRED